LELEGCQIKPIFARLTMNIGDAVEPDQTVASWMRMRMHTLGVEFMEFLDQSEANPIHILAAHSGYTE
jgi:hypothetical protein